MIPMKDELTIVTSGVLDDWGRPTGSLTRVIKGRIDYRNEVVTSDNGEDVVSKAIILMKGMVVLTVNDLVQWIDDYGEHEESPISVSPIKDPSGKVVLTKVVV